MTDNSNNKPWLKALTMVVGDDAALLKALNTNKSSWELLVKMAEHADTLTNFVETAKAASELQSQILNFKTLSARMGKCAAQFQRLLDGTEAKAQKRSRRKRTPAVSKRAESARESIN